MLDVPGHCRGVKKKILANRRKNRSFSDIGWQCFSAILQQDYVQHHGCRWGPWEWHLHGWSHDWSQREPGGDESCTSTCHPVKSDVIRDRTLHTSMSQGLTASSNVVLSTFLPASYMHILIKSSTIITIILLLTTVTMMTLRKMMMISMERQVKCDPHTLKSWSSQTMEISNCLPGQSAPRAICFSEPHRPFFLLFIIIHCQEEEIHDRQVWQMM